MDGRKRYANSKPPSSTNLIQYPSSPYSSSSSSFSSSLQQPTSPRSSSQPYFLPNNTNNNINNYTSPPSTSRQSLQQQIQIQQQQQQNEYIIYEDNYILNNSPPHHNNHSSSSSSHSFTPPPPQRSAAKKRAASAAQSSTSSSSSPRKSDLSNSMGGYGERGGGNGETQVATIPRARDRENNFLVQIRVRPPLDREIEGTLPYQPVIKVGPNHKEIILHENLMAYENGEDDPQQYRSYQFTFDRVYDQETDQATVYENSAKEAVLSVLQGYNASVIAYGQTGTGKTHTMEGYMDMEGRGLIPRAIEEIYDYIANPSSSSSQFLVRASYLQIYNEEISDLLKPERKHLAIREDKKRGVFVEGLSEWVVRSPSEVYRLMDQGSNQRATSSTRLNELSSRSHAVFVLIAEQSELVVSEESEGIKRVKRRNEGVESEVIEEKREKMINDLLENTLKTFKIGKLNLVDLAGSERVRVSGSTGKRLEESKKINQSLSALGNVIAALTDPKGRPHIPYRDSKLTRLLEDSLGGNCLTTMLAMVSPALESFFETLSTLKFANRAKAIKNKAKINEDLDQKALLQKYELELKKLRRELAEKSRVVGDTRNWLKMQEDMQRAEHDKILILKELEEKSREFMREKEEKRKLEQRIQQMQNQLIPGGASPAAVLKIQKEYEAKMMDLERERQSIEEDKQQVDRYKGLLLKQRDIMIVLTAKLNERDQSIITLKDEIEALKKHISGLEDNLDQKTAQIFHLQRLTAEHEKRSPDQKDGNKRQSAQFSDPKKLVTTKQYPPFALSNVIMESTTLETSKSGNPIEALAPETEMLSAEEKIEELNTLLQQKISNLEKLEQDLLEVQTEKVSMESLLREKLEGIIKNDSDKGAGKRKEESRLQEPLSPKVRQSGNSLRGTNTQLGTTTIPTITTTMTGGSLSPATSPKTKTRKAASASKVLSMVSSMLNTADPYDLISQLQSELSQKEEERRRAVEELENYVQNNGSVIQEQPQQPVKPKRELTDDERVRHAVIEKDEKLRQLDEENQSLQILLQKASEDQEAERDDHARQINQLVRDRQVEEALWREERQSTAREVLALKKLCSVTAKERVALHNFMEQKVKSTLDNLYRMVNSPEFDPDAFVFTIHSLQKLVQDSIYALSSGSTEEDFVESSNKPHTPKSRHPPSTASPSLSSSSSSSSRTSQSPSRSSSLYSSPPKKRPISTPPPPQSSSSYSSTPPRGTRPPGPSTPKTPRAQQR